MGKSQRTISKSQINQAITYLDKGVDMFILGSQPYFERFPAVEDTAKTITLTIEEIKKLITVTFQDI